VDSKRSETTAARENPSLGVRELAMSQRGKFAAAGDSFPLALFEGLEIP
jgi:hypothetical protein